jgi:hypothetical protein
VPRSGGPGTCPGGARPATPLGMTVRERSIRGVRTPPGAFSTGRTGAPSQRGASGLPDPIIEGLAADAGERNDRPSCPLLRLLEPPFGSPDVIDPSALRDRPAECSAGRPG